MSEREKRRRWYCETVLKVQSVSQRLACLVEGAQLITPISKPEARKALTVNGKAKAYDYLCSADPVFAHAVRRFEKRVPTGHMNPYNEPYDDRLYHVPTETQKLLDGLFFNGGEGYLGRSIAIVGNKGSGKTATQNCWLHERNAQLEANRVFWVRCDAAKLYDFWHHELRTNEIAARTWGASWAPLRLPTLQEYLDLQLIYVLAKYCCCSERAFIGEMVRGLEDITFDSQVSRNVDASHYEKRKVTDFLREARQKILAYEHDGRSSYMLQRLLRDRVDTLSREFRRWQACSASIQSALRASGYCLLKIADSVDNVHINEGHSKELYRLMMPMLAQFLLAVPARNEVRMATMRERTYYDMLEDKPTTVTTADVQMPYLIEHEPPDRTEVLRRRLEWLRNVESMHAGDGSFQAIAGVALAHTQRHVDDVFHGNIRSYLFNVASLSAMVRFRQMQGAESVSHQVATLRNRNLFLNGRFLLDSAREWPMLNTEQGIPVFNLFWQPRHAGQAISAARWHGLVRVRLLELLLAHEDGLCEQVIVEMLVRLFDYPAEMVSSAIDNARAFGWIDSSLAADRQLIRLSLNAGGRFVLQTLLCQVDTLYYFGLDAKLPAVLVEEPGLVSWHLNDRFERTGFRSAALATALSFLLFLHVVWNIETQSNAEYQRAVHEGHYAPFFMTRRYLWRVARSAQRMLMSLEAEDLVKLEGLQAGLERLLNRSTQL